MISLRCGHCGKNLKIGDELAGKRAKCPGCGKPVPDPAGSLSPQPAPQPPARGDEYTLPPDRQKPKNSPDVGGATNLGTGVHTPTQSFVRPDGSHTVVLDEDARRRFEAAWQAGKPVPIESFLADQQVSHFLATLEELVHIDLEFRWKAWSEKAAPDSRPAEIESYLSQFPKLNRPEIVQRLAEQEFRVRQRHGEGPSVEEYRARFPGIQLGPMQASPDMTSFLAPAEKPDEIGRLGPYRVLKVLGAGGMGVVFKAEDPGLRRLVALKAILPSLASTPSAKERFFREARSAAALKHPHVVGIYYVGEDRGAPFLAMEFLEGEPLDERLKRDKILPIPDMLCIGRQVAEGLAAAHAKGLIHRDIKPANIWLEEGTNGQWSVTSNSASLGTDHSTLSTFPRAKILDFGLARALSDRTQLTQTGAIIGTPAYMAPEQAGGKPVDNRCDLFSLGCVLYRMCTGEMAFKGVNTISILSAIAVHTPVTPAELNAEVPHELSDLIMSMLAKDAEHRPFSAHEVAKALHELELDSADKTSTRAGKTAILSKARDSRKKWPLLAGAGGFLVLLVAVLFYQASRERERPEGGSRQIGTNSSPQQSSAYDKLRREDVPLHELKIAGSGDPAKAAPELVAVLGDSRFQHPSLPDIPFFASLDYSPDGNLIASAHGEPAIRVWNATTGELLRYLPIHVGTNLLVFTPDSNGLYATQPNGNIHAWNPRTGQTKQVPFQHTGADRMIFSRDSKTVVTADGDGKLHIRNVEDGRRLLEMQTDPKTGIAFSPDGKRLALVKEKRVSLWSVVDNKEETAIDGLSKDDSPLVFSPDGKLLAVAAGWPTRRILIYDLKLRKVTHNLERPAFVWSVAFSSDSQLLATSGDGASLEIWNLRTGEVDKVITAGSYLPRVAFAPDGKRLATYGLDGRVRLWDLAGRELIAPGESTFFKRMKATPSGVITHDGPGAFRLWDLASRKSRVIGRSFNFRNFEISGDGKLLAYFPQDLGKTVRFLDTETCATPQSFNASHEVEEHSNSLAVSPDWSRVAVGRHQVTVWDVRTGEGKTHNFPGQWLALTRDGKLVAGTGSGDNVGVFDLAKEAWVWKHEKRGSRIIDMRVSPDDKLLAVAQWNLRELPISLFEVATGKALRELPSGERVAFSPDSQKLASIGGSRVRIWNVHSGKGKEIELGLGQVAVAVDYVPDGRHLVVASGNGTLFVLRLGPSSAGD